MSENSAPRLLDLTTLNQEQWREDLRYLAENLAQKHKNAFHRVTPAAYWRTVREVEAALPQLAPQDIPVEMAKITAQVGDGHTYVALPDSQQVYPLKLYWFGDDLRVIQTTPTFRQALGARVVKIGGLPVSEVKHRLHQIAAQAENDWFFLSMSVYLLTKPEVLHTLGIITDRTHTRFTLESDAGNSFVLDVAPVERANARHWIHAYEHAPLYLQHAGDDFWFTRLPDSHSKTVYVLFNTYTALAEHARHLFAEIDQQPTNRLIIDLRQNGGGNFTAGYQSVLAPIKMRAALNQPGHLFVITGRRTFSAAMSNAAQFQRETQAILVGEPPGEVPNSYQENEVFVLPNSHLMIHYSSRYYQFLDEDVPALMPNQQIDPDWPSYRAGRDSVLEWILAHSVDG